MPSLKQLPSSVRRPIRRMTRFTEQSEHPAASIFGLALLAFAVYGLIAMMPDIKRYLRIRNM